MNRKKEIANAMNRNGRHRRILLNGTIVVIIIMLAVAFVSVIWVINDQDAHTNQVLRDNARNLGTELQAIQADQQKIQSYERCLADLLVKSQTERISSADLDTCTAEAAASSTDQPASGATNGHPASQQNALATGGSGATVQPPAPRPASTPGLIERVFTSISDFVGN